jgi:hypothetical protein
MIELDRSSAEGHAKQTMASGTSVSAAFIQAAIMSASAALEAHEAGQNKSKGNGPYIQVLMVPEAAFG